MQVPNRQLERRSDIINLLNSKGYYQNTVDLVPVSEPRQHCMFTKTAMSADVRLSLYVDHVQPSRWQTFKAGMQSCHGLYNSDRNQQESAACRAAAGCTIS